MEEESKVLEGTKLPLDIPNLSLGQFIFARLKSHNPYDVLMFEAETGRLITPVEFLSLSMRVAEGLKMRGLHPGDVVCVMGKAKIDVYATSTGVLFRGGTVSPLDPDLPPDVFRLILKTTAPKFMFCDSEIAPAVSEVLSELQNTCPIILYNEKEKSNASFDRFTSLQVDHKRFKPVPSENPRDSVAFLVCSSGTMGIPKPVMITDRNLMYQATVWGVITSFNKLMLCPAVTFSHFFWISGILLYLMVVSINFEMTIIQRLEARHVLQVIERQKPVWGMFSPALLKYLTWAPDFKAYDVSSLMIIITGGTSLQKVVVDRVKELWGSQLSCRQSYGVTELSGTATTSGMDDDVLSVGHLLPGFRLKVVDPSTGKVLGPGQEGEIYLKSPSVMKGYMGNEKATREVLQDGWYKTGDVGRYTEGGLIYITGRIKDFIKVGDFLISPLEIEEVILGIPGVADAGVVGIPTKDQTPLLVALVVKMVGSNITEQDIIRRVQERVEEEKHLRGGVIFVDRIPRTPSGKMKRSELMEKAKEVFEE